jgi:tungstate transport system ATP-binding protein
MYSPLVAVNSVSLSLELNKILVLVGANGSGKTTLLRLIAGLEQPDTGSIILDNIARNMDELQQIATLVFQKTVMFNRSVYSNLEFGLRLRGFEKEAIQKKIIEALEIVGLNGFENRKAKKLSGGEQQRVALARAFLLEPKILLLDEPTSNLDVNSAKIIEKVILERKRSNTFILLSTHNLRQAKRLADEIAHIHEGKIVNQANVKDFFAKPKIFFD